MSEVPFPQPMDALLSGPDDDEDAVGWLTFIDPKDGTRTSLPVSTGPSRDVKLDDGSTLIVWHIDVHDDGTATTEPSVHLPGIWHSPYRTEWRIVDQLADDLVPCKVCGRAPGEAHDGDAHFAAAST